MTTKVVNVLKQGGISLFLIIGLLACEGPIDDVGVNIVDNDVFEDGKYTSEVVTYNKNIEKRLGNKLGQHLLGVYKNDDFGKLEATILGQLTFNTLDVIDFGLDPSTDKVILNIPYYATEIGDYENGSSEFELDSIIGNQDVPFRLKISELQTYLNTLDPTDPTEELDYFTDEDYNVNPTPLYEDLFTPNKLDTVLYVDRPEVIYDWETLETDIDTIKNTNASPSIKISLDEGYFQNNFLNNPTMFTSLDVFLDFFNGLYIEAESNVIIPMDPDASLMTLNMRGATMTMYYTNSILMDETVTSTDSEGSVTIISQIDYNGDGDTDDVDVPVRTKQSLVFTFGGVTNNKYTRDYTGSNAKPILDNPNEIFGDEQLFVQGAAGSITLIDLFTDEDLDDLRSKNWLINDANLVFYIDQSADMSIAPEQLFLYNYDDNEQLPDLLFEGFSVFGGALERDDDQNPVSYKISITDYVSRVLAFEDGEDPAKLALRVVNPTDVPTGVIDTEIKDYNWNPKGIILHGNTTADIEKRVKLEITYTEINN
ncbi:MAG: DUF4270 domain-containing protein [Flavobacteriaceae bacterium]